MADEGTQTAADEGAEQKSKDASTEAKSTKATDEGATSDSGEEEDPLTAAKRRARHFEAELKKAQKSRSEIEAELEKFREATKTEQEKALDAAKKSGRDEALKEWKPKYEGLIRRNAALSMLGAQGVKAPALVLPHLGLDDIEVSDDGTVDETALKLAIERVLDEYPFLAEGGSGTPTHHGDMGPRRTPKGNKHDPDELLRAAFRR